VLELAFKLSPGQNHFFVEIVEALRSELDDLGVRSSVSSGRPVGAPEGVVPVLVPPHEWFALTPARDHPQPPELERAIFFCAEQPGTWFFDEDVRLARLHGAALVDLSRSGVRALRRAGLEAEHVPLGFSRHWACPPALLERDRTLDVLHLGIWSEHRARALARCARTLARRRSRLVLSDPDGPNPAPAPNFVTEEDKWSLLRDARVLLNVHVADRPYFEWQRVVQAISNGAAVVSEHSEGTAPLVPGEHFESVSFDGLPIALDALLEDEGRRRAMARSAYELLRDRLPLRRSAERLVAVAERQAARARRTRSRPAGPPHAPEAVAPRHQERAAPEAQAEVASLRSAIKEVSLQLLEQRRELHRLEGVRPSVERVCETPAYPGARPRVTVIVPMHDERSRVLDALGSCLTQTMSDLEVVVVDDGSADGCGEVVADWVRGRPGLALLLMRHTINRGLGQARNTAIDHARAPYVFALDADNALLDTTLERLLEALELAPEASFAYSMLAIEAAGEPVGLRSCFPWDPRRLRSGNFVDAMALWRTTALREAGGYTTEVRLHGWEDYDLLCRVAEHGGHGVLVPEVLGLYRMRADSMLALTDISTEQATALLTERYPNVMQESGVWSRPPS
jgi:hypothetical protein